jgi:hypothetical protein
MEKSGKPDPSLMLRMTYSVFLVAYLKIKFWKIPCSTWMVLSVFSRKKSKEKSENYG